MAASEPLSISRSSYFFNHLFARSLVSMLPLSLLGLIAHPLAVFFIHSFIHSFVCSIFQSFVSSLIFWFFRSMSCSPAILSFFCSSVHVVILYFVRPVNISSSPSLLFPPFHVSFFRLFVRSSTQWFIFICSFYVLFACLYICSSFASCVRLLTRSLPGSFVLLFIHLFIHLLLPSLY